MNDETLISWLIQEVDDFMGAGRVGLYEFLEILRSKDDPPPAEAMRRLAEVALGRILESGTAVLEWHRWGGPDWSAPATVDDIDDSTWTTPTEAPYLAVAPV